MAALSQKAVQNAINSYPKHWNDQQKIEALLKRKDAVGVALRKAKVMADESGEIDSTKVVARLVGLNPQGRVKGNSQTGKTNPNATVLDKAKSYAASAKAGLANSTVGLFQLNDMVADGLGKGINKVFGTNIDTNALARTNAANDELNARADRSRLAANRTGGDWVKGGTEIAATLPLYMVGAGGATRTARAVEQGVRGAGVAALSRADNNEERLYKMGLGALGAGVGQLGGEVVGAGLSKVAGKAANVKAGKLKPKYQEVDNLGKKYDVPTTVGDIKGGGSIKNIETQLERVPVVGISKLRTTQHDRSLAAATKVSKKFKNLMNETDYKAIPAMQRAAQQGDRNATRVLGIINDAGDDTGKILQASAEVTKWRKKQIAKNLYGKVAKEVEKTGNDIVDVSNTRAALTKILDEQNASISPNEVVVREAEKRLKYLDDPNRPQTFKNIRELRSKLGNLADQYGNPVSGQADEYASTVFGNIRQAVTKDLDNFAATSGGKVKEAYNKADKFYAGVMKSKDSAITKAMQSNKPDEVFDKFIKAGKGDAAQNFANSLDDKGRAALRYQMVDDAMTKAWNENKEAFSPAKFAGKFEELAEPYSRLFKGDDKKQMDGFIKLMRHVERAGQFKENPPTGVRLGDVAIVGTALANVPLAVKGASVSLLARTLFTTKAGKNLLLAADNLPPSQQVALDNIMKIATKLASSSGSRKGRDTAEKVAGTKVSEQDGKSLQSF